MFNMMNIGHICITSGRGIQGTKILWTWKLIKVTFDHIMNLPMPIPSHITRIQTSTNATLDCMIISIFDFDWNECLPPALNVFFELVVSLSPNPVAVTPLEGALLKKGKCKV